MLSCSWICDSIEFEKYELVCSINLFSDDAISELFIKLSFISELELVTISDLIFVEIICLESKPISFSEFSFTLDELSELENISLLFIIDSDINSEFSLEEDSYVFSNSLSVDDIDGLFIIFSDVSDIISVLYSFAYDLSILNIVLSGFCDSSKSDLILVDSFSEDIISELSNILLFISELELVISVLIFGEIISLEFEPTSLSEYSIDPITFVLDELSELGNISLLFIIDSDINSVLSEEDSYVFSNSLSVDDIDGLFIIVSVKSDIISVLCSVLYDLSLSNIVLSGLFDSSKLILVSVNLFSVDVSSELVLVNISELIFVDSISDDNSFEFEPVI